MNLSDVLSIVLSPILSTITALAVLFFTKKSDKKSKAREIKMIRIEKLYVPFYTYCLTMFYPDNDTSLNNLKVAGKFLDLFTNNIAYMSNTSQTYFKPFYQAFLNYHFPEESDSLIEAEENLKKAFTDIGKSLQKDYQTLCKELKLEQPIELF